MAPNSDPRDADSFPLAIVTTATNKQRLITSTGTLTSISHSLSSPSDDSHHAPLPTLPFDLVVEILYCLPVNSLLQLRGVCKSWNSLISDPKFAKNHLRGSRRSDLTGNYLMTSFTNSPEELVLMSSPLSSVFNGLMQTPLRFSLNNGSEFKIVGSCDGILCLGLPLKLYFDYSPFVLVWNPSIRKFKILPPLENQPPKMSITSITSYGFGCDHLTDTYKVVAVFCYKCVGAIGTDDQFGGYKTQVKVHTLGTNSWRSIQEFPKGIPFRVSGIFVNGTVNWLAHTFSGFSPIIISLDLGKEKYQEILQPDFGKDFAVTLTLGMLRDCLCIFFQSDCSADVWIMKEYGKIESWTKLLSLSGFHTSINCLTEPNALYISEDDDVLLEFHSKLGHIAVYNSRSGEFDFKVPEIQGFSCLTTSVVYMESLISPCCL